LGMTAEDEPTAATAMQRRAKANVRALTGRPREPVNVKRWFATQTRPSAKRELAGSVPVS